MPDNIVPRSPYRGRVTNANLSGWNLLAHIVKQDDERRMRRWHNRLNVVIVFSLLFAIFLAFFIIDTRRGMQPSRDTETVDLLRALISQSQSFSLSPEFANSSSPANIYQVPFVPPSAASYIYASWTTDLAFVLIGMIFALFRKLAAVFPGDSISDGSPREQLHTKPLRRRSEVLSAAFDYFSFMALFYSVTDSFGGLIDYTRAVDQGLAGRLGNIRLALVIVALVVGLACLVYFLLLDTKSSSDASVSFKACIQAFRTKKKVPCLLKIFGAGDALHDESLDLNTLVSIYADRYDEHLLPIMWDAMKESNARPEAYLLFIMKLVNQAHPAHYVTKPISSMGKRKHPLKVLNLKYLPPKVHMTILDLISDRLDEEIVLQAADNGSKPLFWKPWMIGSVQVLLSKSATPMPPYTISIVAKLMSPERCDQLFAAAIRILSAERSIKKDANLASSVFTYIVQKFNPGFDLFSANRVSDVMAELVKQCFCTHEVPSFHHRPELLSIVSAHKADIQADSLKVLGSRLIRSLTDATCPDMFWHAYLLDIIRTLLHIMDALPCESSAHQHLKGELRGFAQMMLSQSKNAAIFMRFACGYFEEDEVLLRMASHIFLGAFRSADAPKRYDMLENAASALRWQSRRPLKDDDEWDTYVRLHPLKTCLLLLLHLQVQKTAGLLPARDTEAWTALKFSLSGIWTSLAEGMRLLASQDSQDCGSDNNDDPPDTASQPTPAVIYPPKAIGYAEVCLIQIMQFEDLPVNMAYDPNDKNFAIWAKDFDPENSYITDGLVKALSEILPESVSRGFPRVSRLLCLQTPANLTELSDPEGVKTDEKV